MKRIGYWIGLLCVILLAACGAPEALISEPAVKLNLADPGLGPSFQMSQDIGKEDIVTLLDLHEPGAVTDASMRTFIAGAAALSGTQAITGTPSFSGSTVIAVVLVYDSSGNASKGLDNARDGMKEALRINAKDIVIQENTDTQAPFDQSYFALAEVPGRPPRMYMFLFRKQNVVGIITTSGPSDAFSDQEVHTLAGTMFGQWPAPTTPTTLKSP
jgi:hypothetical protein